MTETPCPCVLCGKTFHHRCHCGHACVSMEERVAYYAKQRAEQAVRAEEQAFRDLLRGSGGGGGQCF